MVRKLFWKKLRCIHQHCKHIMLSATNYRTLWPTIAAVVHLDSLGRTVRGRKVKVRVCGGGDMLWSKPLIYLLDAGTSSEGIDDGTLAGAGAGGMVLIILFILIILILVVALMFLLRKLRHKKVQITDPTTISHKKVQITTISLEPNPAYKVSTRQVQSNHPGPLEELVSALQNTTECHVNEGMEEPPQYDYPVVQPRHAANKS